MQSNAATIYTIRRRFLIDAIRRRRIGASGDLQQLRMELAALRSCRALVS